MPVHLPSRLKSARTGKRKHRGNPGHYVTLRIFCPEREERHTRKGWAKTCGVRTGLGINQFLCTLYEANELLEGPAKMTDEVLQKQVSMEFPESALARALKEGSKTIGELRTQYNRGILSRGEVPERKSKRYDGLGNVVHPRTGKAITQEQRDRWSKKYGFTY